jgi:creatinine amidohydrolase
MKPYLLKESRWSEIRSIDYTLAVLPWGAAEAHNRHLPYGTDNYESDFISEAAAGKAWERGAKLIVLPTIPYGVNTGQTDILLDINMNPTTQLAILRDVITVLSRQGIHRFLVLNSHGGNDFKPLLRELGPEFPDMLLASCNWFEALDKGRYFDNDGDHADEMETSLLLHLAPDLVLPLTEAGNGRARPYAVKAFSQSWAWTERKWSSVTDDTGIGNPKLASADKGARFFTDLINLVSDFFYDLAVHTGPWYQENLAETEDHSS